MNELSLIEEQTAYYRLRASEYDEWFLRTGRYDRGDAHRLLWIRDLDEVRVALTDLGPLGNTLEIACGTGLWTSQLANLSDTLTALDSAVETIELNREKNTQSDISFIVADIFEWKTEAKFDSIFFGFWISHVPESHFERFWNLVDQALKPGGKVFFVDSLKTQSSTATNHLPLNDSGVVERRLNGGETFRIVKRFYNPQTLQAVMADLGWSGEIHSTQKFFLFGKLCRNITSDLQSIPDDSADQ